MAGVQNNVTTSIIEGNIVQKKTLLENKAKVQSKINDQTNKFEDTLKKLPQEAQDAYHAYKRLDAAEEKLEELTEKAEDGKITYNEVTAQAQEVENLRRELAELEAKIPAEYKEVYNMCKTL